MTKEQLAEYATYKAEAEMQRRRISRLKAGEKRKEAEAELGRIEGELKQKLLELRG